MTSEDLIEVQRLCKRCAIGIMAESENGDPITLSIVPQRACVVCRTLARPTSEQDPYEVTTTVLMDVRIRRQEQDLKHGDAQAKHPTFWIAIIGEEFGHASRAAIRLTTRDGSPFDLRDEYLDVAATAIAAIEDLDRVGYDELHIEDPVPITLPASTNGKWKYHGLS
jgi:hypothetical protein